MFRLVSYILLTILCTLFLFFVIAIIRNIANICNAKKEKKYLEYIIENSLPIKNLLRINGKYNYIEMTRFDERKLYDNEKFYNEISCEDYLIYQLQYKKYEIQKQIKFNYSNQANYDSYLKEVRELSGLWNLVDVNGLKKAKLDFLEEKIFNENIKKRPIDFSIEIVVCLSNIHNYVYKSKRTVFNCEELQTLIERINDKNRDFYNDKEIWNAICRVERGRVSNKLRFRIYERDGYKCRYCGATENEDNLEIDHIKPIAKGGKSTEDNLQTLCRKCNKEKGARY